MADKLRREDDHIYVTSTHEHTSMRKHRHTPTEIQTAFTQTLPLCITAQRLCQIGLVEQSWATKNNKHIQGGAEKGKENKNEKRSKPARSTSPLMTNHYMLISESEKHVDVSLPGLLKGLLAPTA